jgi:GH35 family endo-1,4-beta-xylanase
MRFLPALFLLVSSALAATIPDGGHNVLPADWQNAAKAQGKTQFWKTSKVDFAEHGKGWRVEVLDDKAGQFQLQLTCALEGEIKSGDKVLVAFDARCVPGSTTDGKGGANVQIENKEPPNYEKLGQDHFEVRGEWETVFIPFPANATSKPGICHASLLPAGKKQTLEIANMRVLNYGASFDLAKLPRPYIHCEGREADAPWRKEALARIEQIRTTDIAVEVIDAAGKPVTDAKVSVQLKRHTFGFGTAVKAKLLMGDGADVAKYREMVDANFSRIVLENDLKPFGWEAGKSNKSKEFRNEWATGALAWARERGMSTRGHYLCWGPWEKWSEELKAEPQKIREHVMQHLDEVVTGAAQYVTEWDAVNHPVGWEDPRSTVDQVIAPDFYADVIKAARKRLQVPLFVNEDQVFRAGRQQEEYFAAIQTLISQGAKPDGLGNMAHFHSSFLPAPTEMLRISDRFAKLVPNLEITEFDVNTNGDEELQADWLRDMLIMAYSHPAYSGFMLWVFWEGAGWKPETALWRKDWSPKPNALVWRDLIWNQWATKAHGNTDANGNYHTRGHLGLYEITVEKDGQRKVVQQTFAKDGKALRLNF